MAARGERCKVAVVFGGRSPEHSISCLSAASILAELDRERYDIGAVGIGRDGLWRAVTSEHDAWDGPRGTMPEVSGPISSPTELLAGRDVVFPVLHGRFGEDGTIQGMLEMLGLPYVGSGVLASAVAMDKPVAKRLLRDAGLPVGAFREVRIGDWSRQPGAVADDIAEIGWPVFVKPARAGSSVGISLADGADDLPAAIDLAFDHDDRVIAEAAVIRPREIEFGVLSGDRERGPEVSVPAEIVVDQRHGFYDFEAKYLDSGSTLVVPADLPAERSIALAGMAQRAFDAIGCCGLARVDFLIGEEGAVTLNEVNTMPGFTRSSAFPSMWMATGMTYGELLERLVTSALSPGIAANGGRRGGRQHDRLTDAGTAW